MALSKEAILGAQDIVTERVEVPEWSGYCLVRGMTGTERDSFEESIIEFEDHKKGKGTQRTAKTKFANIRAKLVARSVVDEDGKRVFTDAEAEKLGAKSGAVLDRLFDVARRLSGMSEQDVEELTKNS